MTANLMLENVTKCLIEGYTALQEHVHGTPTLEYLEGVAKVRHSLSVVAEVLKSEDTGHQIMELLRAAARMCSDRDVNCIDPTGRRDTIGPVIYLLKLLVRQYGMPCLKAAAEVHDWIIPVELRSDQVSYTQTTVSIYMHVQYIHIHNNNAIIIFLGKIY